MHLFGILNITPDSFSDGGEFFNPAKALEAAHGMIADGAYAIDIGAESTRPGAVPLSAAQELARLAPVLEGLSGITISIDTRNAETAREVVKHPDVKFLNDVSGFNNPEMIKIAADSGVNIIAMHSLTVPADKSIILTEPPLDVLKEWISQKYLVLTTAGIHPDKITFDPGIGFGKNAEQSRELIIHANQLADLCHELGTAILYGHSRKSFLGETLENRDIETAKITSYLQTMQVDCIRVHNIKLNRQALTTGDSLST